MSNLDEKIVPKFGRGCLMEIEPMRAYKEEIACRSSATPVAQSYPQKFTISFENYGILKNQGEVCCCVGCVIASLAEVFNKIENGSTDEFSEGWAYGALRATGDNALGMYPSVALTNWRKKGMIQKKFFNYLQEMPNIVRLVNEYGNMPKIASNYKINNFVSLKKSTLALTDKAIKQALYSHNYGLLAVSNTYFGGAHCFIIIGWNDETNSYIIKNSWGTYWGDKNGTGEIPKEEIDSVYLVTDEELTLPYCDVDKADWFYSTIKNLYMSGFVGEDATKYSAFCPLEGITRGEMAHIMVKVCEEFNSRIKIIINNINKNKNKCLNFANFSISYNANADMEFTDIDKKHKYYTDIKKINRIGLMKGTDATARLFSPDSILKRSEISTLFERFCTLLSNNIIMLLNTGLGRNYRKIDPFVPNDSLKMRFSDVKKTDWFYNSVEYMYKIGLIQGTSSESFAPNRQLNRAEACTIIERLLKRIEESFQLVSLYL